MTGRERSLLLDLYAAHHKAGLLVERAVARVGTAADDHAFVSIIAGREPVTPTEISREYGLSLSTVLFRANRAVERGHVERIANPQDGRSFLLRLTASGREILERASAELGEAVADLLDRLDRPAADIQEVLRELQAAVDQCLAGRGARCPPIA